MADEVDLALAVPGSPDAVRAAWRSQPPEWLTGDYRLVDESFESLVYEAQVMGTGMRLLMWFQAATLHRITCTFREDGPARTKVTLLGQAKEPVRRALLAWAEQQALR